MIRRETNNGLSYFEFESLKKFPIIQAIFTRSGGVSPSPWKSLNIGGTVGDSIEAVDENLRRIFSAVHILEKRTAQVHQVHSNQVVIVNEKFLNSKKKIFADGMVSDQPGIAMLMRFADCVPVFLFDPVVKAVAVYHAGWKGTVKKIGKEAVHLMEKEFGSNPGDILAGIGPSIGPDHYVVGQDVIVKVEKIFLEKGQQLLCSGPDGVKLNLWEANRFALEEAGVRRIEISGICTACNLGDWYSHRAENGKTGRFGALVMLKQG